MALTLQNTNYNGEVLERLYEVLGVGNEITTKQAAQVIPGISTKMALPRLSQTDDPIGDYVAGAPTSDTFTTTYAERTIDPKTMTVYQEFSPTTFHDIWDMWKSVGDFTNLELNSQLMMSILNLMGNKIGQQISKNFFQGDNSLAAGNPLNLFDGFIKRADADANVLKPTPAGNITSSNFMDILAAVWEAVPDEYVDDPDYVLRVNTTDWKVMQTANNKLKEAFTGVFGQSMESLYLQKKIQHYQGMPRHHVLAYKSTGGVDNNSYLGVWVDPESEEPVIDRVANNSRTWFIRLDMKADMNYVESSKIVYYEPV